MPGQSIPFLGNGRFHPCKPPRFGLIVHDGSQKAGVCVPLGAGRVGCAFSAVRWAPVCRRPHRCAPLRLC